MSVFQINVTRHICSLETIRVEANNDEEAKDKAINQYHSTHAYPPTAEELKDSWISDYEADVVRTL